VYTFSMEEKSQNVQTILQILKDETDGNVTEALNKLTDGYSMTWVYKNKSGELFPKTTRNIKAELEDVYTIKERKYDIKNVTESSNVVMVELVESYPDPKTGKMYRTPQVIVLEMENGKIKRGRHYCDPQLSYLELSDEQIERIFE